MSSSPPAEILLSERCLLAFEMAFELHRNQRRKGSQIPYLAHLMAVTALVLEDGGDEDQAIAALLHDAVEDQGGLPVLEVIRRSFGVRVAEAVLGCSDTTQMPKPPWDQRKHAYLAHLENAGADVLKVSLADKLHNARSLLRDLREIGPEVWERFNGGRDGSLWYYHALAELFLRRSNSPLARELARVVRDIESQAALD